MRVAKMSCLFLGAISVYESQNYPAMSHSNTLQHTATHYNTPHYTGGLEMSKFVLTMYVYLYIYMIGEV